jgi:magnesium transporter
MPERLSEETLSDPVSVHARSDAATLQPGWTVVEALDYLRANPPGNRVVYFYVVDAERRLLGVVPTRRLLLSQPGTPIEKIMIRPAVAIPESATILDACEFFSLYRFLALPVVDAEKKLVGVLDVDVYTGGLAEGTDDDIPQNDVFQLIGVHLNRQQRASPLLAFRGRFPWLLANVAGGLLAAALSGMFQHVLSWNEAVLALFVPVVLALAESVAIQSVTLTLDALHAGPPKWRRIVQSLLAEAGTGLLLGLGTGLVVAVVAGIWLGMLSVAAVVLGGIIFGVSAAAVFGVAVPSILRLTGRNPSLAAGPIALAITDAVTLTAYFLLGTRLMN